MKNKIKIKQKKQKKKLQNDIKKTSINYKKKVHQF